jgi:endoglucanase
MAGAGAIAMTGDFIGKANAATTTLRASGSPMLVGVNLGGLEDGSTFGTTVWKDYNVPSPTLATAWLRIGCNAARIPHNLYRMQPEGIGTALNTTYLQYSLDLAQPYVAAEGFVIFDPHGFGNIQTSGSAVDITTSAGQVQYLDYMTRLAAAISSWMETMSAPSMSVGIGLMNEPHRQTNTAYQPVWNAAISAIRKAGFKGVILVPWTSYQSPAQFSASNPVPAVTDPVGPCVVDVHCYLDQYNAGTGEASISTDAGTSRFAGLLASTLPSCYSGIVLSETGGPTDNVSVQALSNLLFTLSTDNRVFATTVWVDDPWLLSNGNYITPNKSDPRVAVMLSTL